MITGLIRISEHLYNACIHSVSSDSLYERFQHATNQNSINTYVDTIAYIMTFYTFLS